MVINRGHQYQEQCTCTCVLIIIGVYVTVSHTSVVGVVTDCTSGLESDLDVLECLVNG